MVPAMAADGGSAVKMVVSYGGEIMSCSDTGKAWYAGGENRIIRVGMSERLSELRARLAVLAGYSDVRIQYAVAGPGGDGLDTLHDVADDYDLWVLVTRLYCCNGLAFRDGRVRAFLFPINAPPRLTPDGIPRPASSPSLLESSKQGRRVAAARATFTLPRAQSAMALSTCTPASSMALSSDEGSETQVDSGFEALAEIAAAQRSATGNAASSSATSSSGVAASTGQADSGFDALAAIAAAQSTTTEYTARGAACVAQADSGFEALATVAVARQQRVQVFPPPATAVFLFLVVPVAPVAVFFHAIPVYGCLIPAVL
jgi:hypothetical protein